MVENLTVKKVVELLNFTPSPRQLAHLHVQFVQTSAHSPWFYVLFVMISLLKIKTR